MRITTVALLVAAVAAATLSAQEARQEPRPKPVPAPAAPKAVPAPEAKPEAVSRGGQLANVRIDVKIIDERSGQPATTKRASITVADHHDGSIRSSSEFRASVPGTGPIMGQLPLNVDASPLIDGNRIRLNLGIEYSILDAVPEGKLPSRIDIRNRLSLVLEDAKPLRVTQSADPMSDRRVELEVTATIVR